MRSLGLLIVFLPSESWGFSSPSCSATPECAVLNLVGDCCPNTGHQYLDCCTPSRQCSSNHRCAALGLGGLCCPNDKGHQLDCCSAAETTSLLPTVAPRPPNTVPSLPLVSGAQSGLENAKGETTTARADLEVQGEEDAQAGEELKAEKQGSRFGPVSMIGFLLLLICVPGLCCWICWIKVLNKGSPDRARALPEIVDMESVSAVSTRTETTSQMESSACQVHSDELYLSRDLKESDVPVAVGCCPHVCPREAGEVVQAPPFRTMPRQLNSVLAL